MNRIRQLRNSKGYSQKELGAMVHKTLYAVSKWELGKSQPSHDDLHQLTRILEATSDFIMGYSDVNDYRIELSGEQIPKSLRDVGLERVELLREYVDESGGIHPDVVKELFRLVAEAKIIIESDGQKQ